MRKWVVVWLALVTTACMAQHGRNSHMTSNELLQRIKSGKPPVILDVRSGWEYEKGHVPGAIHLPFYSAYFRHDEINAGHDQPVVVYCEHGPRAGIAAFALRLSGFKQVIYLQGHMSRWRADGLPLD
jgi:rhodanese-related sulfurtransferase